MVRNAGERIPVGDVGELVLIRTHQPLDAREAHPEAVRHPDVARLELGIDLGR